MGAVNDGNIFAIAAIYERRIPMIRKDTLKGFLSGVIVTVLLSTTVFAAPVQRTITAVYNNIQIYVDGIQIHPSDSTGNPVEPFSYNGTTYLPVRAVATALNKEVTWDPATNSIYLGQHPSTSSSSVIQTDTTISSSQFNIIKEGFCKALDPESGAAVNKTIQFSQTDPMVFYVLKLDSITTNFTLSANILYEGSETGLKPQLEVTPELSGQYMHFYAQPSSGKTLPAGKYTFKIEGTKNGQTVFQFDEICQVQ